MREYWIKNCQTDQPVKLPGTVVATRTLNNGCSIEAAVATRGFTAEQWDSHGYNKAVPMDREPFTRYETGWIKGEDMICREHLVTATPDETARSEHEAATVRIERDRLLAASDWTQLVDSTLDDAATVLWQSYRQALRDVPQQDGFPATVDWPATPAME